MNKNLFKKWKNISVVCLSIIPIIVIIFISFWWSEYNDTIILKKVKLSKTNVLDNSIYSKLLNQYIGQDIAAINLKEVSMKIEKHPYVKAARVSKRFPQKIMVEIVERKPIAILQIDPMLLLDEDGIVLPKIDILKNYNLPIMTNFNPDHSLYPIGQKSLSKNVNYTIYWLKQIKDFYNPLYENLSEMKINNNNEMELILSDNPTHILLGRNQLFKKINTLKEFEVKLQPSRLSDFTYLDMRYKNQIIAKNRKI
tara:strand:+ start:1248 stop:2009 length:762 start_codon:yes stop_codon:yes gene_type:complete